MCSKPQQKDGKQFACRNCNECVATRREAWKGRAMAEKSMHPYSLVLTLTYDDDTPENRDSAQMFNYNDVRVFMARLREEAKRAQIKRKLSDIPIWVFGAKRKQMEEPAQAGPFPYLRFIVAGEQGDRNGRCHWHIILYSDVDLRTLGKVSRFGRIVERLADMMSIGKRKRRLHWDLWDRGFVTFQDMTEASASYVLSYCLKDQFTVEKSAGHMRHAKGENFATGLFRMSKRPAIGESWLMQKLDRLQAAGDVLPSIKLKIPGLSGYYVPNTSFRQKLLWGLRGIKDHVQMTTRGVPPQWSTLLQSCSESEPDTEILSNATFEPIEQRETEAGSFERRLATASGEFQRRWRIKRTVDTCGRKFPCLRCLRGFEPPQLLELGLEFRERENIFGEKNLVPWLLDEGQWIDATRLDQRGRVIYEANPVAEGVNPRCHFKGSARSIEAFPHTGGAVRVPSSRGEWDEETFDRARSASAETRRKLGLEPR